MLFVSWRPIYSFAFLSPPYYFLRKSHRFFVRNFLPELFYALLFCKPNPRNFGRLSAILLLYSEKTYYRICYRMQRKYFQAVFFDKVLFFIYSYFSSMTRNGDGRNRPSPFLSMDMMVAKNHLSASFFSSVRSGSALPDDGRYAVVAIVPVVARFRRLRFGIIVPRCGMQCFIAGQNGDAVPLGFRTAIINIL